MKLVIASDHRGIKRKKEIIDYLRKNNIEVIDLGPNTEESVDYPIYAFKLCNEICNNNAELGILLCGTGIGMSIAANKVKGIRCAKVTNVNDTILTRQHNNANVIALSSSESLFKTKKIIDAFVKTEFSNDERHIRRIEMLENYDN
jgi:ribose 5-phosphate isomerase B